MIMINGHTYFTIVDAAGKIGVSAKTIRAYIAKGIIPDPPVIQFGIRTVKHFPTEYMDVARRRLERYRTGKSGLPGKGNQTALFENGQSTDSDTYKP